MARIQNPDIPITMGCARPPGVYKRQVEMAAVDCGINAIAYQVYKDLYPALKPSFDRLVSFA